MWSKMIKFNSSQIFLDFIKNNKNHLDIITKYVHWITDDGGSNTCENAVALGIEFAQICNVDNIFYCIYNGCGYYVASDSEEEIVPNLKEQLTDDGHTFFN
jgi:hypothetical protein